MGCLNSTASSESQMAKFQQSGPGYTYHATSAYSTAPLPGRTVQDFSGAFLHRQGPMGTTWAHYVQGGPCHVDSQSGLLSGPWADCIEAAVHFEHMVDFSRLPEYAGGEGPAGQVLMALDQWLGGREDHQVIMEAAERLEERAHGIADHSIPEPLQPLYAPQSFGGSMQPYGMQPSYGHVQPYGVDPCAHVEPSYTPGPAPLQQPYAPEPGYTPGPTLLQQPVQNQGGMSTGAKVAVGVGAAAVGVAGGVLLANHADEIGDAFGDVAGWVGNGVEDVGEFVEDMF